MKQAALVFRPGAQLSLSKKAPLGKREEVYSSTRDLSPFQSFVNEYVMTERSFVITRFNF